MLSNILHFSGSNLYRHLLGFLTSLFRPMALGPELYGLWNLMNIIPTYGSYLHLGSRTAMRYAIPQMRSRQEDILIAKTKKSVVSGSLLINGIIGLLLLLVAAFGDYRGEHQHGLIAFAVVLVLTCFYEHSISELKGEQNFLLVSKANYVRFSLNFLLTAALIFQFKFYGALAALILSMLITLLFVGRRYPLTVPGYLDIPLFISKVKFGWPIVILDVVTLLLRSIDKLLIAAYIGTNALGLYAIATMILGPLMNIPGASREVVEQALMARDDGLNQKQKLEDYYFKPLRYTAYLMPALIGCTYLPLPIFIDIALPDYKEAVEPTQILLISSYFLALSYPCRGIIVANKWQMKAAGFAIIAALANLGLSFTMLENGFGIEGVAMSTGISFALLFLILFSFVFHQSGLRLAAGIRQMPELVLPFLVMLSIFFIVDHLLSNVILATGLAASMWELTLFIFSYAPVMMLAKKFGRL